MSARGPAFPPAHRGGAGPPLVLLHGFTDTWRVWELVLPALERRHAVLAPTFPGHAGGPALPAEVTRETLPDAIEAAMDAAGIGTAHIAGNSLGGYVALQLAARGRARSVVAFAPAGGWAPGDAAAREMLGAFVRMREELRLAAPNAPALLATPEGRRRVTRMSMERSAHVPTDLLADRMLGAAACAGTEALVACARRDGYELDAERIACPVRIVWGTRDAFLPWPAAASRHLGEWLPHADLVVLDEVGHCPQLDVPEVAADLVLGFTAPGVVG